MCVTAAAAARDFVRALLDYFQVVNTAEQVHRTAPPGLSEDGLHRQPGGTEETIFRLRDAGLDLAGMQRLLASLRVVPVFSAHPTAPTRRTILRKHQAIVRRLVDMQNPALTPSELAASLDAIRTEITAIWPTEENPVEARNAFRRARTHVFFLTK